MTDLPEIPSISELRHIHCGSCTACCSHPKGEIWLDEAAGDDPAKFDAEWVTDHPHVGEGWRVKRKADGTCIYLVPSVGCGIWGRHPMVCASFDCRQAVVAWDALPSEMRDALMATGHISREVLDAGRQRLEDGEDHA